MRQRGVVFVFSLLTALLASGYGVMFTMLDNFRDSYGISAAALGAVVAVGFFSSFLAQVLLAPLADRGHARRLVLIGIAANLAGLVTMSFGKSTLVLVLARVTMGIGAGMAQPAIRRIVILADPEHLGTNVGRLLAADVAGFAAGPVVAAVLVGPFGIPAPFLVIAVATLVCLPLVVSTHVEEADTAGPDTGTRFAFDLLRIRPYRAALCFGVAIFVMMSTFDALWVLVLDDLDTAEWIANLGIVAFAAPLVFFGAVGGRLAQRVGPFRLGTVGLLVGAGFMLLYGQLSSGLAIFVVSLVHSMNDALTISSTPVAVGMVTPPDRQAGAQGLLGGVQTLVGGIGAISAGWLYQHHGRATAYTVAAGAMVTMVVLARLFVGPAWGLRGSPATTDDVDPAATPVTVQ